MLTNQSSSRPATALQVKVIRATCAQGKIALECLFAVSLGRSREGLGLVVLSLLVIVGRSVMMRCYLKLVLDCLRLRLRSHMKNLH